MCRRVSGSPSSRLHLLNVYTLYFVFKVESLKTELAKKDTELAAAATKVETFEKHQSDLQEHISVLHSSNKSKESHTQNLQQEVSLCFRAGILIF